MPNPESISGTFAVLAATTTPAEVKLDPDREYDLFHTGLDEAGLASSAVICLATGTLDPDTSSGPDKLLLPEGRAVSIGPNITLLKFRSVAGAATISVSPGRRLGGRY